MAKLTFYGAAQQVTGSMHLLEANGKLIVLDCGLFQGRRKDAEALNRKAPCDPKTIHAVILSHAHIDHSGRLPLLVRDGFEGVIHATPATRDLCALMLADSAHIQEEDARFINKRRRKRNEPEIEPLYVRVDAVGAIRQFQASGYGRWFKVASGVHARFFEAGHMLGSAGVQIEINEPDRPQRNLVFTGDVGRWGVPILRDPAPLPECDYLICESTYGGRNTDRITDMKDRLVEVVQRTVARGGKVVIPAFSVGRTQNIVYNLNQLFSDGSLKRLPVYIDSPLAVNATEIFQMHPECYDRDASSFQLNNGGILGGPDCIYVRHREESKKIDRRRSPCITISASGTCEAGRILHHLKHTVKHERNTILIVGYQGKHTLGRRIVEGAEYVKIFSQRYKLKAEVVVLNGFSAHADARELKAHTDPLAGRCKQAFLVHGEIDQSSALAETMRASGHKDVRIPAMNDSFTLD